ncbi:hypothetical protein SPV_2552 [Streptococcus pneumoniae]|nr:hypothetical protein SPV_2552 [Streptococcus pneumoniae]
MLEKEYTYK